MASRRKKGLMLFAAIGLTAVLLPASADAATRSLSCTADGDRLDASVTYFSSGSEWYVDYSYFTINDNYQDQNNVIERVKRQSDNFTWWVYTSGDNVNGEQTYRTDPNVDISKSGTPYFYGWARMDQAGKDPSCSQRVNIT